MNITKKIFIVGLITILGLSACNLPSQSPGTATAESDAAATATLLALTLATQNNLPLVTEIPSSTPFPTDTPTITPTFTPTVPMVKVSVDTNCRTGPGVIYDRVGGLLVGEEAVVVGKFTPGNYWVINNPDSSGTCWLWGQYATVSGNTAGLPEYTQPRNAYPNLYADPAASQRTGQLYRQQDLYACSGPCFNYQFVLLWTDSANNEDGYRVYFNGALLTSLPANATTFPHVIGPMPPGVPFTYEVEAFNATGPSAKKSITVSCP